MRRQVRRAKLTIDFGGQFLDLLGEMSDLLLSSSDIFSSDDLTTLDVVRLDLQSQFVSTSIQILVQIDLDNIPSTSELR